jgi:choline dehydrogenase-like flavoprotein
LVNLAIRAGYLTKEHDCQIAIDGIKVAGPSATGYQTIYDPTSTCKMGLKDDDMGLVDQRFKVLGIQNLQVIVAPEIVLGNTNAPTIMIKGKVAEMIIKVNAHKNCQINKWLYKKG